MSKDVQPFLRSRRGVMHLAGGVAAAVLLLSGSWGALLYGQVSEADKKKRDAFLKAREEMRTVASPTPKASPKGKPKPAAKKAKKKATPTATPKKATTPAATPKKATTPKTTATPPAQAVEPVRPELPAATAPPAAPGAAPTPVPPPPATALPDQITIEKSGLEEAQGYEPPPPPPPRRGFFARLFGGGRTPRSYRYLNRSVIEAIRRAPVQRSRWKFIIVHNSGTRQGNARAFDYYHKRVKRMQNGMAYHFVVGNGRSSGDGEIEIGDRWRRQING
ncbi:MAG: hypothetical protein H0V56_10975, partial [Chthoniobacterales bacterium]|nr:hypothetical protein [Chthoniobacterales bacterium]